VRVEKYEKESIDAYFGIYGFRGIIIQYASAIARHKE